jgi:hypothetical protein
MYDFIGDMQRLIVAHQLRDETENSLTRLHEVTSKYEITVNISRGARFV